MKKFTFIFSALAIAAMTLLSCNNEGPKNPDVEDGFYVNGPATGLPELSSQAMMAAGFNEVTKEKRDGMYEKYIALEAGQEFELLLYEAGYETRYSAVLTPFTLTEEQLLSEIYGDNPKTPIYKGTLVTGKDAPAMKVDETSLCHIILDLNKVGDLANAQIIVVPCTWGVRGAMNGWGFTELELKSELSNTAAVTYELKKQEMSGAGEFKFAHADAWKVTLDEQGKVKAEVSLGGSINALAVGPDNIAVPSSGLYDITFTYNLKGGAVEKSFSATATKVGDLDVPEQLYMIGGFCEWNWANAPEMIAANSEPGAFWILRYFEAGAPFKFNSARDWDGKQFGGLNENEGVTFDGDGNCVVDEAGLYMVEVDVKNSKVNVHKAEIFGMGTAFGGWDEGAYPYTINADGTATITVAAADEQHRTYVKSAFAGEGTWWHREFIAKDGKIVYRATGGDPDKVAVTAGQTITFNFNEGTSSIQ